MFFTKIECMVDRRDKLRALFVQNPYKAFQMRMQSLDPQDLFSVWWEDLRFRDYMGWEEHLHSHACITVQKLHEFSDFLGMQIASIRDFFFSVDSQDKLLAALIQKCIAHTESSGIQMLVARIPLENAKGINQLLEQKFYFVCGETTLTCDLSQRKTNLDSMHPCVRVATLEDLDQVQCLSVLAHQDIRYLSDRNFDPVRVKSFYSMLPQRALTSNLSRQLLVYEVDGKILGYLSYGINTRLRELPLRYASLDYIAVHPLMQGKKIGHALNSHALSLLQQRGVHAVCVRTMASNYPAISVLVKSGFRVTDQNIILHRMHV